MPAGSRSRAQGASGPRVLRIARHRRRPWAGARRAAVLAEGSAFTALAAAVAPTRTKRARSCPEIRARSSRGRAWREPARSRAARRVEQYRRRHRAGRVDRRATHSSRPDLTFRGPARRSRMESDLGPDRDARLAAAARLLLLRDERRLHRPRRGHACRRDQGAARRRVRIPRFARSAVLSSISGRTTRRGSRRSPVSTQLLRRCRFAEHAASPARRPPDEARSHDSRQSSCGDSSLSLLGARGRAVHRDPHRRRARVFACAVGSDDHARLTAVASLHQALPASALIRPISARYSAGLSLRLSERILVSRLES